MKRLVVLSIALLLLAVTAGSVSAGGKVTATDLFLGSATTGAGMPMPIEINPMDVTMRADGAIGLGYTYAASGEARGDLPGSFTYEEKGYLFFLNPMDPTTFAGSAFVSGVFTLSPKKGGPAITIADTDPAAYDHGIATVDVKAKGALGQAIKSIDKKTGLLPKGGSLTYGYFTFTNEYGTFTGYATPDFRQFAISITFAR